ncbi:hypothetical protein [Edaphobacter modestus]|uniref:hypothetical protein n=1 Tax=Edaphobacter modestus TaxID=388466 RepID=UPI00102C9C5A|nr:hypothetical protein [Edaphobacter modestus]
MNSLRVSFIASASLAACLGCDPPPQPKPPPTPIPKSAISLGMEARVAAAIPRTPAGDVTILVASR